MRVVQKVVYAVGEGCVGEIELSLQTAGELEAG